MKTIKKSIGVSGILGATIIGAILFVVLNKWQSPEGQTTEEVVSEWGKDSNNWGVKAPVEERWTLRLVCNNGKETYQAETATNGNKHFTLLARRDAEKGIIKFAWYKTYFFAEDDPSHELPLLDLRWILVDSGSLPDPFPKHGTLYQHVSGTAGDGSILMAFREHENKGDPLANGSLSLQFHLVRE